MDFSSVKDTSGGVMVIKLFTNEFDSHWVPHSYCLVTRLSKKLSKLQLYTRRKTIRFVIT